MATRADKDGKPLGETAADPTGQVNRLSIDGNATVKLGDSARGGNTRGDYRAADHEMGCEAKAVPFGRVDEDSGRLQGTFGSSRKTRDCIVDSLQDGWNQTPVAERTPRAHRQRKVDNGPASSGVRTPFLKRRGEFAEHIGKPIQRRYDPPDPSNYNPIERGWGRWEQPWKGPTLVEVDTLRGWAPTRTWKGSHPIVKLSTAVYQKGGSRSKKAMPAVEARVERNPLLPTGDRLIRPA